MHNVMRMLCVLLEGRKGIKFSHLDSLADLQLSKMNAAIGMKLIANAMLLLPNDAIFVQTNIEKIL